MKTVGAGSINLKTWTFRFMNLLGLLFFFSGVIAEDGYRLWLRYEKVSDSKLLASYKSRISSLTVFGNSETIIAAKQELETGLTGLLGQKIPLENKKGLNDNLIIGKASDLDKVYWEYAEQKINNLGKEGFLILSAKKDGKKFTLITANTDIGVLYGAFRFLKLLQTNQSIENIRIADVPGTKVRILNHWDNLDRVVERGYAGFSIWDWHRLPGYLDPRYKDYARANASIGINGTVLTNVNANALVLTEEYLEKVKALANVFRPYGIRVYLTARFSAPIEIGKLKTADPLDSDVKSWWKNKIDEIYRYIPDFGGFLVKANSEGQPGPQNYGRDHADGANMLAEALALHGGIVMWRAFVYDNNVPVDRAKQAYNEFKPLDGKFLPNVMVQVKNGAIDFQPREPFHPLLGAMPHTPLMMEFQITKEYLGFATHLVYLGTLFQECLQSDTYAQGKGSLVADIIDRKDPRKMGHNGLMTEPAQAAVSLDTWFLVLDSVIDRKDPRKMGHNGLMTEPAQAAVSLDTWFLILDSVISSMDRHELTGMAGVANIGNDINWCGHPFLQANWYAFGRLAWSPHEDAGNIAEDWIRMTFSNDPEFVAPVKEMMMQSRENTVNYMTPLGLHHIMGWSHHYGPGPWIKNKQREDWTSVYYHRADSIGIGFDRTSTGSNALSQYAAPVTEQWTNLATCPEKYLLWFHHVNWNYIMKSGRPLWDELCYHYYAGVDSVREMQKVWKSLELKVDGQRFEQVKMLLAMQEKEAVIWRNSCILYFQTFSKLPIPKELEVPEKSLEYYMNLKYSFVPGN